MYLKFKCFFKNISFLHVRVADFVLLVAEQSDHVSLGPRQGSQREGIQGLLGSGRRVLLYSLLEAVADEQLGPGRFRRWGHD